jgi:hypothetical protein
MNTAEAKAALGRVLTAFPSYRQWLESTSKPLETLELWCEMLADCDSSDVTQLVAEIVAGDFEPVGRYEKPDVLARNIKREANERRFKRVEKERQMRNYHGQSKHAMKIVGDMVTGKLAIRLGTLVKAKQLTPEQNEQMMDELMEWDRKVRDGNKDAEKPEWFEYV